MIVIDKKCSIIDIGGESMDMFSPKRLPTNEEQKTITSVLFNGTEYIYYQGDEPLNSIGNEIIIEDEKINISEVDIDSSTDEQILKLKARFEAL